MIPDDTVTNRAEEAALGAILLQPQALSQIGWLRSADFTDRWHACVHDLLRSHAPTEVSAYTLGEWLRAAYPPAQADLPRVLNLLEAAPLRSDPVLYARMVLEASIRRDQASYGVLLRGGALQSALTGTAHPVCAAAAFAERALAVDQSRWEQAHLPPGAPVPAPPPQVPGVREALLGADRYLTVHGCLQRAAVRARERDLIATLITHPHAAGPVIGWLDPGRLTDRTWRATYQAISDLTATGERIDEVTVLWRTEQLARANGAGPEPGELRAQVDAAAGCDPAWCARAVAGDQLRALAAHASAALNTNATNPGLRIPDLLDSARAYVAALADLAQNALPHDAVADVDEPTLPLLSHRPPALSGRAG